MAKVLLCADEPSLSNPSMLGLEGELLERQPWLRCASDPELARRTGREEVELQEAWVISNEEVEPINLAAVLKQDRPELRVYLVSSQESGSLTSRVKAASLDGKLALSQLAQRYQHWKGSSGAVTPSPSPAPSPVSAPMGDHSLTAKPSASRTEHHCYLLSVVSASGGVGKSTISALLAWASHLMGSRTLVLDGDLQFGDLDYLMGQPGCLRADELIDDPSRTSELEDGEDQPVLLGAPRRLERAELVAARFDGLLDLIKERFDCIVINTGSFWSDLHLQLLEKSTNALFLIDQRPSSIQSSKHALELCARCGVAANPFLFALNRCSRSGVFTSIDVSCALNGALVSEFQEGGSAVEEILSEGAPSRLFDEANPLALSVASWWAEQAARFITLDEERVAALLQNNSRRRSSRRRRRG